LFYVTYITNIDDKNNKIITTVQFSRGLTNLSQKALRAKSKSKSPLKNRGLGCQELKGKSHEIRIARTWDQLIGLVRHFDELNYFPKYLGLSTPRQSFVITFRQFLADYTVHLKQNT
jgi:hypothetical protein